MVLAAETPIVGTGRDYTHLVQDYRVHGSLYTVPSVFADEMKRIFTDGWVFVGHESEIPNGGDWVARRLGTEQVLMARTHEGEISVVANRCAHRGTTLCPQSEGNSRNFRCPYHAWTYDLDGTLLGAPFPQGFVNEKPDVRLDQPGQVSIYRGFVFANQSGTAGPLAEHLGPGGSDLLDRAADMSPTGRLQLNGGWIGQRVDSNWKMWPESDNDGYHIIFAHESLASSLLAGSQYEDVILEGEGRTKSVARDYGGGHVELDFRRSYTTELAWLGAPRGKVSAYCDDLEEAFGVEKAKSIMWDGPPHAFVFPNLFLGEMNIARIDPLAPGLTEHHHTPLLVETSDPGINRRVVLQSEAAMGPASFFLPEDVVIAERMHRAFDVGGATDPHGHTERGWVELGRGIEREQSGGGQRWSDVTDETTSRGFWHHYRCVMSGSATSGPAEGNGAAPSNGSSGNGQG